MGTPNVLKTFHPGLIICPCGPLDQALCSALLLVPAGELVIIDVNYFPSFKGIPEAPAALQAALRQRYAQHLAAWQAHHAMEQREPP